MKLGSVVFTAVILLVGIGYEWVALAMPRGTFAYPGPGLFPVIVGVFLVVTALGCLLQEIPWRRKPERAAAAPAPELEHDAASGRNVGKTYQVTALTIGYILLLKPVGYPICICAFLALAIRIFGYRRWLPTLVMAGIIAAFSYVSFAMWLKVPLPLGILEDVLG